MNYLHSVRIRELQAQGYKVVIKDIDGRTFNECYEVFQRIFWDRLKRVIVTDEGEILAFEG